MMSREKENTNNNGSVKCIYNHWETLNNKERVASLNNIAKKLTTNDSHYLQSIKQEYYLLIRERTGEKIIFFSFFLFMVMFSDHNLHDHSNIFLDEFIEYLGRIRTQRETLLGYVRYFF